MLIIGAVLFVIPLQDMEIILPLKNVLITNVFITSGVLFVISIVLFICNKCLKKLIVNKKEKTIEENMI